MALTDAQVRKIQPEQTPRKHSDGGGLHLLVAVTGSKLWRLNYRFGGKQKTLALGSYPTVR
ncbi:MAG: Arm DNA-binding domain-containing protein [Hyphomicrobiales bacterium]